MLQKLCKHYFLKVQGVGQSWSAPTETHSNSEKRKNRHMTVFGLQPCVLQPSARRLDDEPSGGELATISIPSWICAQDS